MTDKAAAERPAGDPSLEFPGWARGAVVLDANTPAEPPAEEPLRPFWRLDRSEQRVLWITLTGGVASILLGAAIVGIALALARLVEGASGRTGLAISTAAFTFAFVVSLIFVRWTRRRLRSFGLVFPGGDVFSRVMFVPMVVLPALGFVFTLLVWIGIAAGIK